MAWVRIHDGAMTNPKIDALSDSAFRLWVRGLSYCQMHLTNGLIPHAMLRLLGAKRKDVEQLSTPLATDYAPLWEPHDGGFRVHDYLFWNDSREKVQERQQKSRDRLDRWRREHGNEVSNGARNSVSNGSRNAAITKPNQTKPNLEDRSREEPAAFVRFLAVYPKRTGRLGVLRWWKAAQPSEALTAQILAGAERYAHRATLLKPEYVKNPLKWLEDGHWEDEQLSTERAAVSRDCPHVPPCASPGNWQCQQRTELERVKAGTG